MLVLETLNASITQLLIKMHLLMLTNVADKKFSLGMT